MVNWFESFKLSESEEIKVKLNLNDVCRSRKDCERSIVGRIFRENVVNFTGLIQTIYGDTMVCGMELEGS